MIVVSCDAGWKFSFMECLSARELAGCLHPPGREGRDTTGHCTGVNLISGLWFPASVVIMQGVRIRRGSNSSKQLETEGGSWAAKWSRSRGRREQACSRTNFGATAGLVSDDSLGSATRPEGFFCDVP